MQANIFGGNRFAVPQLNGCDVESQFINESRLKELRDGLCSAGDGYVLLTGCFASLFEGFMDTSGDELETCSTF